MTSPLDRIRNLAGRIPEAAPKPPPRRIEAAPVGTRPTAWQIETPPFHETLNRARTPVRATDDLDRILALPRRAPVDLEGDTGALVARVTAKYARPNPACKCASLGRQCIRTFNAVQAWALEEMAEVGGLLGPVATGAGKSLLDIMAAMAVPGCKQAVLFVPPNLQEQIRREYELVSQHFIVPSLIMIDKRLKSPPFTPGRPVLRVVPYSLFSRPESPDMIKSLAPDLIILDEAHKFRNLSGAGAGRFSRFMADYPTTRVACWSGTFTSKSIRDFAHLSAYALAENSPLPLDPAIVQEWAYAIDPSDWAAPLGALKALCAPGEHIHNAFHRRLVDTKGVVATKAGALGASLIIEEKKVPEVPSTIAEHLSVLRATWTRPDGEEFVDAMAVARCARELAMGFFYRWKYPRGESEKLILEWLAARKAWHKELRQTLKHPREHMDSPFLCAKAAIRAYRKPPYRGDLPVWQSETWPAWKEIRDKVKPISEPVWVDEYLARDIAAWSQKHKGVVWCSSVAVGHKIATLAGIPFHGGGPNAESAILSEKGDRSIVASIQAHGTGRDGLQRLFDLQVVLEPPPSGQRFEQLLARLHRPGQESDEVTTLIVRHTPELVEAFDRAIMLAGFLQGVMGNRQKLLSATITFPVGKVPATPRRARIEEPDDDEVDADLREDDEAD